MLRRWYGADRRYLGGVLLAVMAAITFSGKAIIVKLAYRHGVDPFTLIMMRMVCALPFFAVMAWWAGRGQTPLTRRDWGAVVMLGFVGYYLASTLDFLGLQYISAGLGRLILYLSPTLVLILGWCILRQPVGPRQFLAMAVSYAGAAAVFVQELHGVGPQAGVGAVLVFISAISYALYLLYSGQWVQKVGALRLTGWTSLFACLFCILQYAALRPWTTVLQVPTEVWTLSWINGTVCTVLPIGMVMMAVQRIGAAATAQAGMVGPLTTVAFGAWWLGEPFNAGVVVGLVMVLAGVALLAKYKEA